MEYGEMGLGSLFSVYSFSFYVLLTLCRSLATQLLSQFFSPQLLTQILLLEAFQTGERRSSEYIILAYWIFWVKGNGEKPDTRRALWPSLFFQKERKFPCKRCPPYTTRKNIFFITRDGKLDQEIPIQTNLVKLTVILLVISPRFS